MHNAFKYAQASRVVVACVVDNHQLRLSITDDGVGFIVSEQSETRAYYGLRNIKRRVAKLGEIAEIESVAGQETRVLVIIPMTDMINTTE